MCQSHTAVRKVCCKSEGRQGFGGRGMGLSGLSKQRHLACKVLQSKDKMKDKHLLELGLVARLVGSIIKIGREGA
jgi:hypothetical protein